MDVQLPDLGGLACCERIRALNASARILVIGGFLDDDSRARVVDLGGIGFLQKPFDLGTLARRIREALDSA
jgi:DNA-binding response OmpR family regulator